MNRYVTDLRNIGAVTRLQLHRRWRRWMDHPKRLALRIGLFLAIWAYILFRGGGLAATGAELEHETFREMVRGMAAIMWIVWAGLAAYGTPRTASEINGHVLLLRSGGVRATLWGTLLADYVRRIAILGGIFLASVVVMIWNIGFQYSDPLVFLGLAAMFVSAELVGRTIGLAWTIASIRIGAVLRVGILLAVITLGSFTMTHLAAAATLAASLPMAVFGDVILMSTPGLEPNHQQVWISIMGTAVLVPVLIFIVERLADRAWFSEQGRSTVGGRRTHLGMFLARLGVDGPQRAIAWRLWIQSRRSPFILFAIVSPPVIVLFSLLEGDHSSGSYLWLGLFAGWAASVGVGLNSISSEDETLPHLLSAPGPEIVRGYSITTLFIGVPVIVLTVLLSGVLLGPLNFIGPELLASVALFLAAVPLAIFTGLVLPRIRVGKTAGSGPVPPGKLPIFAFTLGFLVLASPFYVPLLLMNTWTGSLPQYIGLVVTIGLSILCAVTAYRLAARHIDGIMME